MDALDTKLRTGTYDSSVDSGVQLRATPDLSTAVDSTSVVDTSSTLNIARSGKPTSLEAPASVEANLSHLAEAVFELETLIAKSAKGAKADEDREIVGAMIRQADLKLEAAKKNRTAMRISGGFSCATGVLALAGLGMSGLGKMLQAGSKYIKEGTRLHKVLKATAKFFSNTRAALNIAKATSQGGHGVGDAVGGVYRYQGGVLHAQAKAEEGLETAAEFNSKFERGRNDQAQDTAQAAYGTLKQVVSATIETGRSTVAHV